MNIPWKPLKPKKPIKSNIVVNNKIFKRNISYSTDLFSNDFTIEEFKNILNLQNNEKFSFNVSCEHDYDDSTELDINVYEYISNSDEYIEKEYNKLMEYYEKKLIKYKKEIKKYEKDLVKYEAEELERNTKKIKDLEARNKKIMSSGK